MGRAKSKQRRILVNYCGEMAGERILLALAKLYLEETGGRLKRGNEHGNIGQCRKI